MGDTPFHCSRFGYSCVDWDHFHGLLRDGPWEDISNLGAFAAAFNFWDWVQAWIDVHILL